MSMLYYLDDLHSLPALLGKIKEYFVTKTTEVNGHALSASVTLTNEDVGAPAATAQEITLTTAGWANKAQTVSCNGVTETNTVIITPKPSSYLAWHRYKVRATVQGEDFITFATEGAPDAAREANVLILDGVSEEAGT